MPATPGFHHQNALPHLLHAQPTGNTPGLRWPHSLRVARRAAVDRANRSAPLAHHRTHVIRRAHRHLPRRHPLGRRRAAPASRTDLPLHLGHHAQPHRMARPHHAGVCGASAAGGFIGGLLFGRSQELRDGRVECLAADAAAINRCFRAELLDWRGGDLICAERLPG
jgi:hypothetical protein